MRSKEARPDKILPQGVLLLFYHDSFEVSGQVITTMASAGVQVLEYTNRGHKALDNCYRLKQAIASELPEFVFGIGTIKPINEAHQFIEVDAHFVVSPMGWGVN